MSPKTPKGKRPGPKPLPLTPDVVEARKALKSARNRRSRQKTREKLGPIAFNMVTLRMAKGMSQPQLAGLVGCSTPEICLYERGKRKPSVVRCMNIAAELGCTLSYLVSHKPSTSPQ